MKNITRRDLLKNGIKGTLIVTFAGAAGPAFSFLPDGRYDGTVDLPRRHPFRKSERPRKVTEVVPGFFWLDAADFEDYGGWALDTQFAAFMGSSYLIAHGTSAPVENARTSFNINTPGRYRLWVRCKNWIPEHSPGRFKVSVAGRDSELIFGSQKTAGWSWQDGGIFQLAGGDCELALKDQTGFFGRCSSLILTRDLNYVPHAELENFQKERRRLKGSPETPEDLGRYDVVVTGAGPAGACAALAAAREDARTLLINDRPVLGGNAGEEIMVPVNGAADHLYQDGFYARESGLIEEAVRISRANGWWHNMTRAFEALADSEPNLRVLNNTRLVGARMEGSSIDSAELLSTLDGRRSLVSAPVYVDCTGDGWLGYYAGADYRIGNEARSEFNEPLAPAAANNLTMSGCLRAPRENYTRGMFMRSVKKDHHVPFNTPPWVYIFDKKWRETRGNWGRFTERLQHGTWWLEHCNTIDDFFHPEEARDELIRINFSYWNYLKNDWKNKQLAANFELDYVPFTNGKRESRRLEGDLVLTQNHLQKPDHFPDAIGHCGWPLDIHAPKGIFDTRGPFFPGLGNNVPETQVPFGAAIPFRVLYSSNVSNLLMAGRAISVSRLALGSVRIQGTCAVTGQAAGTAAALCSQHETTPRGIYRTHTKQLQQTLLKNDQFIPGVDNSDPHDLAREAEISASSFKPGGFEPQNIINGWTRPLNGKSNMWCSSPEESLPQWIQLDFKTEVNINTVQCIFDTDLLQRARSSWARTCVTDYRIECLSGGKWHEVAREQGNILRLRRHTFDPLAADALRLTVLRTNGDPGARVFEIRVYN